jgi:tetratricopeptide (TPR) repeat protein
VADEIGDRSRRGTAALALGLVLQYLGEWDAARNSLDLALETAHTLGPVYEGFVLLDRARLSILEGDWAGALRQLEDLIRRAEQINPGLYAEWLLARLGVLEGRARVTLERLEALRSAPQFPKESLAEVLPILAEAYLAEGNGVQALHTAALAVRQAREQKHRPALVDALVVHGTVLGRQEKWAEAMKVLDEVTTLAREMGYLYAEGRALRERGLIEQWRGQSEQARVDLEAARIIFERLGARRDLEHAEQAISTLPG